MWKAIIYFILFNFSQAANADLFTYRDEKGTLHAVRSAEEIPLKFRGQEKKLSVAKSSKKELHLRLKRISNSFYVPVNFGDTEEFDFVLDTGASVSMISTQIAEKIRAKSVGTLAISTAGGIVNVPVVEVEEMGIQGVSVKKMKVTVKDLPLKQAAGLLGMDFFAHFQMQLDTESGDLRLKPKYYPVKDQENDSAH